MPSGPPEKRTAKSSSICSEGFVEGKLQETHLRYPLIPTRLVLISALKVRIQVSPPPSLPSPVNQATTCSQVACEAV